MGPISRFAGRPLRRLSFELKHRAVAVTGVLAVASMVTACAPTQADARQKVTPSPSASAASLPTSTPSAFAEPTLGAELAALREAALGAEEPAPLPEISQLDEFGATAAAVYFMDLYRYAFLTGDTTPVEKMSDAECVFCNSTIEDARAMHDAGTWAEPWSQDFVGSRVWFIGEAGDTFRVEIDIDFGEIVQHDALGLDERRSGAETQPLAVLVRREADRWLILEAEVLDL